MRARMSIVRSEYLCEHREVILRDRPVQMMKISPKGTVPVLLLPDGTVIEESLEIMQHVLDWELDEMEDSWVNRNDNEFKFHLDRYKYPNRYGNVDAIMHRNSAKSYLDDLDNAINKGISTALNDALFPFVRQFANHDREWFDTQSWTSIHDWLADNLNSTEFLVCMKKYPQWHVGDAILQFPLTE